MVAIEAAHAVAELGFEREDPVVALHDLARAVLPQLLDVAEEPQLVACLQVPPERGAVRALAAPEVVRPVPAAAVVIAEHDGPQGGQVDIRPPGVAVCFGQAGADPLGIPHRATPSIGERRS